MDAALVDSNILLRLSQPEHADYLIASAAVDELLIENVDLCVVPQNLVEFWAVATRPSASRGWLGMKLDAVDRELNRLRSLFHLLEGAAGIADSWQKVGNAISGQRQAGT